jgi:DNA-binding NtrC family response regulator
MTAVDIATKWASPTAVLLVDDDADFRLMFKNMASTFGLDIDEAVGVSHAREAMASREYRAVFLDLHLGDGTALDLLSDVSLIKMPVVLITGHLNSPLLDQALRYGPCAFMRKPADFSYARLEQLLVFLNLRYVTLTGEVRHKPGAHLFA